MHVRGHVNVQRGDHLIEHLHHRHLQPGCVQVFGHFHADIPAADHHRGFGVLSVDEILDFIGVGDVAQRKHPVVPDAFDGRHHGLRAHGEDQLIVAFGISFARVLFEHGHGFPRAVDCNDLALHAYVHVEPGVKAFGRLQGEIVLIGNLAADVVRQPAVGKGDVITPLKHNDLGMLVEPAQPGRSGRAARNPAHDEYFLAFHGDCLL